jgi:hypothetical protein
MNSKPNPFSIVGWLGLVLLIYVLAVGPAVRFSFGWYLASGFYPIGFAGTVWQPIMALDQTKARPLYRSYMRLWGVTVYEPDW